MKTTNLPNILSSFVAIVFIVLTIMTSIGCSTEIDLNAEPKDIWIVYGALREEAETQDIRIAKAFLIAGDAIEFAKENDQSVTDLRVVLSDSRGNEWIATQVDSVPKDPADGAFFEYTTVYRFDTPEGNNLIPGRRYDIRITQPGTDTFAITAYTYVPLEPTLVKPVWVPCQLRDQRNPQPVRLHNNFDVEWSRGRSASSVPGAGLGFELRVFFDYEKNGEPQPTISWGPTSLIIEAAGCVSSGNNFCYRIGESELLNHWLFNMAQDQNAQYTFEKAQGCTPEEDLPQSLLFEVTAVDSALSNYMRVNDPRFTDFNTVRTEFTNITAEGNVTVLGVFGSTTKSNRPATLEQCSEWLLNLNDAQQPNDANCAL